MAETGKRDLRDTIGKPGVTPARIDAEFIGKQGTTILPNTATHEVKPLPGDKGGVAEGQVTKSN
jgi:hypothetical protein